MTSKRGSRLTTAQIGKCGELLVQFQLLRHGVESAPLTTDYGIDLVAYFGRDKKTRTIQVKSNEKPKRGGGRGSLALGWWFPDDSEAELFAFVDLSSESVWLFGKREAAGLAQQHPRGRHQLYMYVDSDVAVTKERRAHVGEFVKFKLENKIKALL